MLCENSDLREPAQDLNPTNFGWLMKDNCYVPDWFDGSAIPEVLFDNTPEEKSNLDFCATDDASEEQTWSDENDSEEESC